MGRAQSGHGHVKAGRSCLGAPGACQRRSNSSTTSSAGLSPDWPLRPTRGCARLAGTAHLDRAVSRALRNAGADRVAFRALEATTGRQQRGPRPKDLTWICPRNSILCFDKCHPAFYLRGHPEEPLPSAVPSATLTFLSYLFSNLQPVTERTEDTTTNCPVTLSSTHVLQADQVRPSGGRSQAQGPAPVFLPALLDREGGQQLPAVRGMVFGAPFARQNAKCLV